MTYTYKKSPTFHGRETSIVRSDGACIPICESNTDYQEYLKWLNGEDPYTEKGTPEAAD